MEYNQVMSTVFLNNLSIYAITQITNGTNIISIIVI